MTINKKNRTIDTLKIIESHSKKKLTLGNLLSAIRQGEELSQVEFAKMLGVKKQYLCDIECGRRFCSPKAAAQYAEKLGYSIHQFVRLCLQDMVDRAGMSLVIDVKAA